MEDRASELGFEPQKELIYNKFLPYAATVDEESCKQLCDIKANLARSVQIRDLKTGSSHWVGQLSKYIRMHGMKFSKEDHILFIHLLFELVTIPDLEISLVVRYSQMIVTLLKKRHLLSPADLTLPWKPLYQLVESITYSQYEPHGLQLFPQNIDSALRNLVSACRMYFPPDATQEMLDEWRPLLCPFDITMSKGMTYFEMFLPTSLPPEQHEKGFKLWFDELMALWDSVHNSPSWEQYMVSLLARLANQNIGFVDWEPWLPKIFTRFLRSLNLPVGTQQVQVGRNMSAYDINTTSWWITSMMGGESSTMKHLNQLFNALKSFYHPSNHGRWNYKLQRLLSKIPENVARRLHRERHKKPTWENQVPESFKLKDSEVTELVQSMKPLVLVAMFSKLGSQDASSAFQHLASMRPELIIPPLLERTYPALETLTEPHRLTSCLSCLVSVTRSMLQGGKWYPQGPTHILPILHLCLPGIDSNDLRKSLTTFQLIATFVSLVPLVDCSQAIHVRKDLTEVEKVLCSATAQFEDFLSQFMDRIFTLIENCAHDHTHRQDGAKLSQQETMLEIGLISTFSAVMQQCSASLFKVAVKRLHRFVTGRVLEVSLAGRYTADLVRSAAKANAEATYKLFVPHFCRMIKNLTAGEDVQKEEHLDAELMWNLKLLSEIVRCDARPLLPYKDDLIAALRSTLHLTSKAGSECAGLLLRHILRALSLLYAMDYRSVAGGWDRPLDEYLPIRDWGRPGDLDDIQMRWHIPSVEEKACATELLTTFLVPELEKISKITKGEISPTREELLRSLKIIEHCILGCGSELPAWEGEAVSLITSLVELKRSKNACTVGEPISIRGQNVRILIINAIRPLLVHMLSSREDDTKAITQLVKVYSAVMYYFGCQKEDFDGRWKSLQVVKRAMENKCIGKKKHIRALLVDRIQLQHDLRSLNRNDKVFTQLHQELFGDLLQLSISRYSEVRKKAQQSLSHGFHIFSYSYRSQLNDVLKLLVDEPQIEHHQFKGALYVILSEGKRCLAIRRSLDVHNMIWPALVRAQHSEKPSILKLVDAITERIHKHIETTALKIQTTEGCLVQAGKLAVSAGPAPSLPPASDADIQRGLEEEQRRNQTNLDIYHELVGTLVTLVEGGTLRWKFSQLGMELLGMMIRHDTPLPSTAVNLFVKGMIHEKLDVRKLSVNCVSAILKQQKRKHKTISVNPYEIAGVAPPSEKNRNKPGDREDNQWHHYKMNNIPDTKEKWEACIFVEKTHWGYYTWPRELKVYAALSEQPKLGRSQDELSPEELPLYQHFSSKEYIDKLVAFLTLEDQKGKDRFNSRNFTLFKGLFRNYDDAFVGLFRPHIERLVTDTDRATHDSSQRCAAELISGIIRGMKHWSYEKTNALWDWLIPTIKTALTNISPETVSDWGTCFATAAESRDPRKLFRLFELLMTEPLGKDGGSFSDASRLYVLQGALAQQEWRVPSLLHQLLKYLMNYISHPYKNVRDRLGSVLTNCFLYDFPQTNGSPTSSPKVADFIHEVLPQLEILRKFSDLATSSSSSANEKNNTKVQEISAAGEESGDKMEVDVAPPSAADAAVEKMEVDNHKGGGKEDEADDERKTAIKLIKTMMVWLTGSLNRMLYSAPQEIFKFLPLVCILESESQDPEIQHDCSMTLACMAQALVQPQVLDTVLKTISEVSQLSSWHARAAILGYTQVLVFCNLFNMQAPAVKEGIKEVVIRLMCDDQLEVREMAAVTFTGFLHCNYWEIDQDMVKQFESLSRTKLKKKKRHGQVNNEPVPTQNLIKRHAGVLGLGACVQAFPYEVPSFIPQILMDLSIHLSDPQPIQGTAKKILSSFRRTHHDNWQDHKQKFTDDQLVVLTDVLVSPNYYA